MNNEFIDLYALDLWSFSLPLNTNVLCILLLYHAVNAFGWAISTLPSYLSLLKQEGMADKSSLQRVLPCKSVLLI